MEGMIARTATVLLGRSPAPKRAWSLDVENTGSAPSSPVQGRDGRAWSMQKETL
jgi:hypothetical protein